MKYVVGILLATLGLWMLVEDNTHAEQREREVQKTDSPENDRHAKKEERQLPPVKIVNKAMVELPLYVKKFGRSAISHIDIYITKDDGKTWEHLERAKISIPLLLEVETPAAAKRTVSISLGEEGTIYGLSAVVRNKAGRGKTTPKVGESPQVRIELDKTAPQACLYAPEPHPTRSESVILSWKASDRNLHDAPISLSWAERKKGPWQLIGPEWMANTGKYEWQPPDKPPSEIYLRLMVRDKADNRAVAQTAKPILIDDLKEPAAFLLADELAEDEKDHKGEKKVDNRIFELRTYTAAPGKMDALNARFRDHTNKLFEKHGMTIIGFWMPAKQKEGEEKLIYILAYPSKESAEKSWKAFRDDPDWKKVVAETEKNGRLLSKPPESVYMNPTDYSPLK